MTSPTDPILLETQAWVTRAVIGLNLCPFARAVQAKHQIRYVLSHATKPSDLLKALHAELHLLAKTPQDQLETTLLVHPHVLNEFEAFNQFLEEAEGAVDDLGYSGTVQVASFHPQFQFAGTEADDITNATNRSPYPTLHLLREASVERALDDFPHPESIYEANIATMKKLRPEGWSALMDQCKRDAAKPGSPPGGASG